MSLDDDDLTAVLRHPINQDIARRRKTELINCLDHDRQLGVREWQDSDSYAARHRIVTELNELDAFLFSYTSRAGDPTSICEYYFGTIEKHSPPSDFLLRLNRLGLIGREPSLTKFIEEFKTGKDCPRAGPPPASGTWLGMIWRIMESWRR
jgi:hypothetical protein